MSAPEMTPTVTAGAHPAGDRSPSARQQQALDQLVSARTSGQPSAIRAAEQQVALAHLGLAAGLARRYGNKGLESADLLQVANLGLVKAVKRWDPQIAEWFGPFAYVTILGEIRRSFRDQLHIIRLPRAVSEISVHAHAVLPELEQRLRRHPSRADIAAAVEVETAEFDVAQAAAASCRVCSLDDPAVLAAAISSAGTWTTLDEPGIDRGLLIAGVLAHLTTRQQQLVQLRFVDGLSQQQIAQIIGVSQMQISRLLRQLLSELTPLLAPLAEGQDLASAS